MSGATGVAGTTTTTLAPETVKLTSETMQYASFEMKGGVWMELPVYLYTGTVVNGGYQVSFRVVPLPSQYLDFATTTTAIQMGAR